MLSGHVESKLDNKFTPTVHSLEIWTLPRQEFKRSGRRKEPGLSLSPKSTKCNTSEAEQHIPSGKFRRRRDAVSSRGE